MTARIAVVAALSIGCSRVDPDPTIRAGGAWPATDAAPDDPTSPCCDGDPPADPGPTRVLFDADYLPAAIAAIEAADRELAVAEFLLYDDSGTSDLLDAIGAAARRGVAVRVLADEEGSETEAVLENLGFSGVATQLDSRAVTLHNKLIVADDVVLVGSHNVTSSALRYNHEASVLVADAEVAGWYRAWFDAMWVDPTGWPDVAALSRADLEPVADLQIEGALRACLDSAVDRVDLVMYAIAWDDQYPGGEVDRVLLALEGAATRGVDVRVVLDASDWITSNQINDAAVARLEDAGVAIWRTPSGVTTHAKVLRCDDTVVIGDANWSYSGLVLYHGTSLVARSPALARDTEAWAASLRGE